MTPGVDFVLFADRRPRFVRGWQWRPLPAETAGLSPTMVNRFAKFFPHVIFPEAEVSIYVDANTLMLADLTPLIEEFRVSGADIGLFPHKQRFDIAEEFAFARKVENPAEDAERGAAQLASTAPRGCRTTISSPRTRSSSAGTATRRSRRRWTSGGSRWRHTPSATS